MVSVRQVALRSTTMSRGTLLDSELFARRSTVLHNVVPPCVVQPVSINRPRAAAGMGPRTRTFAMQTLQWWNAHAKDVSVCEVVHHISIGDGDLLVSRTQELQQAAAMVRPTARFGECVAALIGARDVDLVAAAFGTHPTLRFGFVDDRSQVVSHELIYFIAFAWGAGPKPLIKSQTVGKHESLTPPAMARRVANAEAHSWRSAQ